MSHDEIITPDTLMTVAQHVSLLPLEDISEYTSWNGVLRASAAVGTRSLNDDSAASGIAVFWNWVEMYKWTLFTLALLFLPIAATFHGTFLLFRYRRRFGKAPLPMSRVHGVVIVSPEDYANFREEKDDTGSEPARHNGNSHHNGTKNGVDVGISKQRRQKMRSDPTLLRRRAMNEPPLRLLVIGDSLARGVGVSRSATPVLPEIIARTLSKFLGGRAVFWTCHGEPGASTGWVVQELERNGAQNNHHNNDRSPNCERDGWVPRRLSSFVKANNDDASNGQQQQQYHNNINDMEEWKRRLQLHEEMFDSGNRGQFDVAVVLTGTNDIKSAFLPLLNTGRKAAELRGGRGRVSDFREDMRLLIEAVGKKMKTGFRDSLGRAKVSLTKARESLDRILPEHIRDRLPPSPSSAERFTFSSLSSPSSNDEYEPNTTMESSPLILDQSQDERENMHEKTAITEPPSTPPQATSRKRHSKPPRPNTEHRENLNNHSDNHDDALHRAENGTFCTTSTVMTSEEEWASSPTTPTKTPFDVGRPLIVLPATAAANIPNLNSPPLGLFLIPLFGILERIKIGVAKRFGESVIFIPQPTFDDFYTYESMTGPLWFKRRSEDTILSIRNVHEDDCQELEGRMLDFYAQRGDVQAGSPLVDLDLWRMSPDDDNCHSSLASINERNGRSTTIKRPMKKLPSANPSQPCVSLLSGDGIHPNDVGYDCWGRHIARAIIKEWTKST